VGYPKRENCGTCHYYGGGGLGVKHGDLDTSLDNPASGVDVHMGGKKLLCIDCHRAQHHAIPGRSFSVSVQDQKGGISCLNCHADFKHQDARIQRHTNALACQACHIPRYAEKVPTKMVWDWSKAGDAKRKESPHEYLKIKGEFKYGTDLVPEYLWFNGQVDRYLAGDRIAEKGATQLNPLHGDIRDPQARIWPFKRHIAKQPYDTVTRTLLVPVTGGEGGYWHDFNWDKALRLGVTHTGQAYSGHYGFTQTEMLWPLSHMVKPKEQALRCVDCHGPQGRLDFKALGYPGDPAQVGGRKP
jgi:octaheme c-type cytochrome (tetrathionate reductase family)